MLTLAPLPVVAHCYNQLATSGADFMSLNPISISGPRAAPAPMGARQVLFNGLHQRCFSPSLSEPNGCLQYTFNVQTVVVLRMLSHSRASMFPFDAAWIPEDYPENAVLILDALA